MVWTGPINHQLRVENKAKQFTTNNQEFHQERINIVIGMYGELFGIALLILLFCFKSTSKQYISLKTLMEIRSRSRDLIKNEHQVQTGLAFCVCLYFLCPYLLFNICNSLYALQIYNILALSATCNADDQLYPLQYTLRRLLGYESPGPVWLIMFFRSHDS